VIPLRRWAFPRPCGFSLTKCAGRSRLPARPLFEFYLLTEFCPAKPSRRPQPATPLLGFRSLRHMRAWRSTLHGLCLPATFRLQGLATLLTACSLQDRVGHFSCRRRPWDLPYGAFTSQKVFRASPLEWTHMPFATALALSAKHRAGTPDRSFWVLTLPGIPGDQHGFSKLKRWLLPWVCTLPGHQDEGLGRVPPALLSRAFRSDGVPSTSRRPRVSIDLTSFFPACITGGSHRREEQPS
jgi:hypothetical protein